jgi:hypothetical protein
MAGETQFGQDVIRWAEKTKRRAETYRRKFILELATRIIQRSPVKTGFFRGNWQLGIGSTPSGTVQVNDRTGQIAISRIDAALQGLELGAPRTYLVNNTPYGPLLEMGSSRQAPSGMVRITLMEAEQIAQKAVIEAIAEVP